MLAILYLVAMTYLGDRICRLFYRFASIQHRLAAAYLTGLLLSTVITFLGTLASARFSQPLIAGNLVFLAAFGVLVYQLPRASVEGDYQRPEWSGWDWFWLTGSAMLAGWLVFVTLGFKDGAFQIPFKAWSDFGANLSLTQSFALGHNFPPEHPFFPGETIRNHFLFWFQAANLEFLGLNVVWAVNLLSFLAFVALLILIRTFAELLFKSAAAGRIAGLIFFFSTSLSFLPFLRAQTGFRSAVSAIAGRTQFLSSGYPYRGEDWGVLTVDVFANQRHLISAVGLMLVVLTFLIDRYNSLECSVRAPLLPKRDEADDSLKDEQETEDQFFQAEPKLRQAAALQRRDARGPTNSGPQSELVPYIWSGLIIGALPYWNSAIFVAAMVVLVAVLILLPRRLYVASMILTALIVAVPQVLLFRRGVVTPPGQSLLTWGYTLQSPTIFAVVKYLGWIFGFKWLLIAISLVLLNNFRRRMFLALLGLVPVVFLFQLSTDMFNNHKLLNVWSMFAGVYAAYGLWRIAKLKFVGIPLAIVLATGTVAEGVINLFPVHNDSVLVVSYQSDRLTEWVFQNTKPTDVFLTQTVLTHPILFAGRRVYLGYTLFAWTAGYDVSAREKIYRRMFEERDPFELAALLRQNKIAYVAFDDGVRNNRMIQGLNEAVFQEHFQKVFEDHHHYDNIVIYKTP